MLKSARALFVASMAFLGTSLHAADWPQWRGPDRDGVAKDSPPLAREWGPKGPKLVWESPVPHGQRGDDGFGSPVIANGRVHQLVTWTVYESTPTRTLTTSAWQRMGAYDPAVPAALSRKIETARVSAERGDVPESELDDWLDAWIDKHLSKAEREQFSEYAEDRLRLGDDAASLELLAKLQPILDKPFADTAALKAWLTAQKITGDDASRVREAAPTRKPIPTDTIITLDAATGRKLWQKDFPGGLTFFGTSGTPCVTGGRVYSTGAAAAYCLDAATGETVWRAPGDQFRSNSSPAVADGVMVFVAGGIRGLDAATGKQLWIVPPNAKPAGNGPCLYGSTASAAVHWADGKAHAVAITHDRLFYVEMKTGRIVWERQASRLLTTPAVWQDFIVFQGNVFGGSHGLTALRLTPKGPELVAQSGPVAQARGASAAFLPGRALAVGRNETVGMAIPSGKIIFQSTALLRNVYTSPLVADGKLMIRQGGDLKMLDVSGDEAYELASAPMDLLQLTSPAMADGLLYVRTKTSLKCYDLRALGPAEVEAIHAWKRQLAKELGRDLDSADQTAAVEAARKLARLGPVGQPLYIERVRAAAADPKRLAVLLEGAAGACREIRSAFTEPLRQALRGTNVPMVECAVKHWQVVFPASEAKPLLLGVLRGPAKRAWRDAIEELLKMDPANLPEVVDALCAVAQGSNDALSQEAALLVVDVVAHASDPAARKRASAAIPVLEQMVLFEKRTKEARDALVRLRGIPAAP